MAQSFVTDEGTLIVPGAYPKITVQSNNSGLATTGVLMLVGESDTGLDYTNESDLESNAFAPDSLADVISKYGSGPLVDAFRAACSPSSDLAGSFSKAVMVKTNPSTKASGTLLNAASGTYGTLFAKKAGKAGNLITYSVTQATAEGSLTTGAFTCVPAVGTVNLDIRLNGGPALAVSLPANQTPAQVVTAVDAVAGIDASGGVDRGILAVSGTLDLDANPAAAGATTILLTRSVAWVVTPSVGDTLTIPTGSAVAGAGDANVGAYVITAASSLTITAVKLSDAGKAGATAGVITNPVDVTATAILAVTDAKAWSPVTITATATAVSDGLGKSLEISELTTGTDLLSRTAYNLSTTAVTWVSKSSAPQLLTSATEYKAQLNAARASDGVDEQLAAGGDVALKVSYTGTTASLVIDKTAGTFAITVAGGAGASIPATKLTDYPTISDLATFLGSKTGYKASVGNAALGQLPTTALDSGTFTVASTWGAYNGRIKVDAYKFIIKMAESSLVQLNNPAAAANAGLPAVKTIAYLAGAVKGATTAAIVSAAIDALEGVQGNFLVPLFSRDASLDILAGLTDSSSTYQIDAINLAAKAHVLKMSTLKKRRNRQAFLSKEATFALQKEAASNLASSRCSMCFEDFKQLGGDGTITQFQPWMGAVLAAAMQAAGFYRAIFNKGITTAGIVHAAGDYNPKNDSHVEDALQAGLLPARKSLSGGFIFDSDQTTYTKDANFVFNSIQAMYAADVIALSTAQRMQGAFVGQSTADVSAAIGLSFLEGIMADFLRLKLIAPSDDAAKGFKNARVRLNGGNMIVEVEIKLAGAIYFIPVSFLVSPVTQST